MLQEWKRLFLWLWCVCGICNESFGACKMKKSKGKSNIKKVVELPDVQKPKDTFNRVIVTLSIIIGCIIIFAVGLYALKNQVTDVNFYNGFCFDKADGDYTFTQESMKDIGSTYKVSTVYQTVRCMNRLAVLDTETMVS